MIASDTQSHCKSGVYWQSAKNCSRPSFRSSAATPALTVVCGLGVRAGEAPLGVTITNIPSPICPAQFASRSHRSLLRWRHAPVGCTWECCIRCRVFCFSCSHNKKKLQRHWAFSRCLSLAVGDIKSQLKTAPFSWWKMLLEFAAPDAGTEKVEKMRQYSAHSLLLKVGCAKAHLNYFLLCKGSPKIKVLKNEPAHFVVTIL